jgi:hypothetical protein
MGSKKVLLDFTNCTDVYKILKNMSVFYVVSKIFDFDLQVSFDSKSDLSEYLLFSGIDISNNNDTRLYRKIDNLKIQWKLLTSQKKDFRIPMENVLCTYEQIPTKNLTEYHKYIETFFSEVIKRKHDDFIQLFPDTSIVMICDKPSVDKRLLLHHQNKPVHIFCKTLTVYKYLRDISSENILLKMMENVKEEIDILFVISKNRAFYHNNRITHSLPLYLSLKQEYLNIECFPARLGGYYKTFLTPLLDKKVKVVINTDYYLLSRFTKEFEILLKRYENINIVDKKKRGVCKICVNEDAPFETVEDEIGMFSLFDSKITLPHDILREYKRISHYNNDKNTGLLNTYFEHIFVIHLRNDLSRIKNLLMIDDHHVRYYVVDAISYKESAIVSDFVDTVLFRNFYDDTLYKENKYNTVSRGSICLNLTNILVMNYCIDKSYKEILMFEDDVVFHRDIATLFPIYFKNIPSDWQVAQFGSKQNYPYKLRKHNEFWNIPNEETWATHAYALKNCLHTIRDFFSLFTHPIDVTLQKIGLLKKYVSRKDLFITFLQDIDSNIQVNSEIYGQWGWDIKDYITKPNKKFISYINEKRHFGNGWDLIYKVFLDVSDLNDTNHLFFDFADEIFGWESWKLNSDIRNGLPKPYNTNWSGIIHHPYTLPDYFGDMISVENYMNTSLWRTCVKNNKKLFALSHYLKSQILEHHDLNIIVLKHPIILDNLEKFSLEKYYNNKERKIVAVGWSFRKLNSIYKLHQPPGFQKVWLCNGYEKLPLLHEESNRENYEPILDEVKILPKLSHDEYYKILCSNIVFLDFIDASANNAIVECINTHTPMLIRRHPAVVEYLGDGYPMYFYDLDNVYELLQDEIISSTVKYLKELSQNEEFKIHSFFNKIYSHL